MNDEQYQAAIRAERQLHMTELQKKYALLTRSDCIRDSQQYHLPYRVLLNISRDPQGRVCPNPYYPAPGASAELQEARSALKALQTSTLRSVRAMVSRLTSISDDTKQEIVEDAKETFRKSATQVAEQIRDLEEKEILPTSQYDFYYTCFLQDENFDAYKVYDWTGDVISAEEAQRLRKGYHARQNAFLRHPEQFAGYFYIDDKKRPESTKFEPPIAEF